MRKLFPPVVAMLTLLGCAQLSGDRTMKPFNVDEVRAAERELESALSSTDPVAWVQHYTEDAVFVAPGGPPVQGREALTRMARSMRPLSEVRITDIKTEGSGSVAAVYGRGSWVSGAGTPNPSTSNIRVIIVWRKEADGRWRVAQELLHSESVPK